MSARTHAARTMVAGRPSRYRLARATARQPGADDRPAPGPAARPPADRRRATPVRRPARRLSPRRGPRRPPGEGPAGARARRARRRPRPPSSVWPACFASSPGPSARGARRSSPTGSSDARPSAVDPRRGSGDGRGARRLARRPRAAQPRPTRRRGPRPDLVHRRRRRRPTRTTRAPDPTTASRPTPRVRQLHVGRTRSRRRRDYAVLPIPSAGDVALGFEFDRPADAAQLADRLPPTPRPPRRRGPVPRDEPAGDRARAGGPARARRRADDASSRRSPTSCGRR